MKKHGKETVDRNQKIIAGVVVLGAIVTILGAWYLVQLDTSPARFEPAPLRAQPGTERERRLEIEPTAPAPASRQEGVSEPVVTDDPLAEGAPEAEDSAPPFEDAPPQDAPIPEPVATGAAMAATLQGDPATGLARVFEALTTAPLAEASALYTAAGLLHLQGTAPNEQASQAAFEQALEIAQTPTQRHDAAFHLAELWLHRGQPEQALATLSEALPSSADPPSPSRATVRLRLFQGSLFEQAGDHAKARACYDHAWNLAREVYLTTGDADAASVYRQASLALSRHHRSRGDAAEAEATLADMRATLGEEK